MKCEICGEREVKVHYTEMKDDHVRQLRLCEKCAEERGFTKFSGKSDFKIPGLLAGMADAVLPSKEPFDDEPSCPSCGHTYDDLRKVGRLGCAECYEALREPIGELLERIHGSDRHAGKAPGHHEEARQSRREITRRLETELDKCVREEDFEQAAVLRDQIRAIEEGD